MRSDRQLVGELLDRGDETAFRELYRRHTPRLFQLSLRMMGGAETDAEDIIQETWIRVCERVSTFRWESTFATWLTAIGLNLCREFLRRRGRFQTVEAGAELELVIQSRPGSWIDIERAIASLPDGYRAVFVLHDIEGYTHEEIGDHLGISDGTSKSQLSRARRAMRATLGSYAGDEHVSR